MRRIGLAVVLAVSLALVPLAAESQQANQANQLRRVGVLMRTAQDDPEAKAELAAFRQGLQQLGWSEGRNIRIDIRFAADSPDQYEVLAKQLIALQPDAIFARTTPITASVQCESRTIPIVFAEVSDPVGSKFVASFSRPGGNLTGLQLYDQGITGKWAAMLKEIAPHVKRVALLVDPRTTPYDYFLRSAEATTQSSRWSLRQASWKTRRISSASSRPSPPRQIVACSSCRVARPACTATSSLHSRRSIVCHRSIPSDATLLPVV